MVTKDTVASACADWRKLASYDDPMGVAMELIDEHARDEGLVDDEGYGIDSQIDLAASEWGAWAAQWFADNPKED